MTVSITIIIPRAGNNEAYVPCQPYMPSISSNKMKWGGIYARLEGGGKKKQSIKPSNDKYGIALSSEYYSRSLRMLGRLLGMKRRSLFVCKWEIDYIYLLAEGLVVETRTHTQRRAPPHANRASGYRAAVSSSAPSPGPRDRGKK